MNIFEQATRQKIRFPSAKGELTTEQLWELPLTSKTGFDLDTVAREVNRDLKETAEESFVSTRANPARAHLELKLELVKHVIAVKITEADAREKAASRTQERQRLQEILARKQDAELEGLSVEDIQKRLAELG